MTIGFFAAFGLAVALVSAAPAPPSVFDVRQYGAAGDGKALDTPAFNSAIAACSSAGGGQVLVPPDRKPRLAFAGVRDVRLREAGVRVAASACVGLNATGDPMTVAATVQNGGQEGLSKVQVTVGGQTQTQWVWMQANERKDVVFTEWQRTAGPLSAVCGELRQQLPPVSR